MSVSIADELKYVQSTTLRRLRLSRNLTLRQVSIKAYVATGFLSDLESGRKNASPTTLAALLQCYGLTTDDWYKEQHFTHIGKA